MKYFMVQWNGSEDCLPYIFETERDAQSFLACECEEGELHIIEVEVTTY